MTKNAPKGTGREHEVKHKKCKWNKVSDANWLKQIVNIKDNTSFFENVIGIE